MRKTSAGLVAAKAAVHALALMPLAILAWQNTKDATETFPRHRPKPIPRPGDDDKPKPTTASLMGGMGGMSASVMPVEEFQRRIQERRASRGA